MPEPHPSFASDSDAAAGRGGQGAHPGAAMFRAFFEQATHFAAILDLDGRIIELNRVSLELGGYTRDEVIG